MKERNGIQRTIATCVTLAFALPAAPLRAASNVAAVGSFKIAADLSRRSSQELAAKQAASTIAVLSATLDPDGDGFPEAPGYLSGAGPTGGGLIPTTLGAPISDGYGANLGYCVWDNGSIFTAGQNRLVGSTSIGAPSFAVVSAGLDGVFNRTCAQIAAAAVTTDDDFVVVVSTAQIRQGVGGTVYFGDPVATLAALNALTTTSTRDGELRLVKNTNSLWRWNSSTSTWLTTSTPTPLSSLTAATVANTINNAAFAQSWNWQLGGNTTGFAIGENVAASGGTGSQYLTTIGTLAGSTAVPLSVAVRGVEAFRVDSVNPQIVANAGSATAPSYAFNGAQGTGMYLPAANTIGFATASAARLTINPTGNVGIGTTSPGVALDVVGTIRSATIAYPNFQYNAANRIAFAETFPPPSETGSVVSFASGSASRNMLFSFGKTGVNTSFLGNDGTQTMLGSEGSTPITFRTGLVYTASNIMASGTEAMRLAPNGNVLIGSATDNLSGSKLQVTGGIFGQSFLAIGGTAINTRGAFLQWNRDNSSSATYLINQRGVGTGGITFGEATQADVYTQNMFLDSSGNLSTRGSVVVGGSLATGGDITPGGKIVVMNGQDGGSSRGIYLYGASDPNWGLYMGQAGAGKSLSGGTATASLDGRISYAVRSRIYNSSTTSFIWENGSEQALMSLTADTGNLYTKGNIVAGGTVTATSFSGNGAGVTNLNGSNITSGMVGVTYGGTGVNGSTAANGQLLIGNGAGYTLANITGGTGLSVTNGAGTIALANTGVTGFNTRTGAVTLTKADVDGVVNFGTGNMTLGTSSMPTSSSGSYNIALGGFSLSINTTGQSNTAVGYQALAKNTGGFDNNALGYQSLYSNSTGSDNNAFGFNSLLTNSTGSDNNAVGSYSLYKNSTGISNNAVGSYSLTNNSTGNYNNAFGIQSLYFNSTGSNNIAIGSNSLFANGTGSNNTAIGYNSLFANGTGNRNSASGALALFSNSTGSDNLASGYGAGYQTSGTNATNGNTTGSNNTFVGSYAMPGTTTQLNYGTALGSGALVSSSNTIVLGRASDNTVIGATSDDGSLNKLQVTGGVESAVAGYSTALKLVSSGFGAGNYVDLAASTYGNGYTNGAPATIRFSDDGNFSASIVFRTKTAAANSAGVDVERMRITSGGRVLIGSATDNGSGNQFQVTGGVSVLSGAANLNTAVIIGRASEEAALGVAASSTQYSASAVAGDIVLRASSVSNRLLLQTGGGNATLAVTSGKVGIGNINPSSTLDVTGTGYFSGALTVGSSGTFIGAVTAASYTTTSDRRLKENIVAVDRLDTLERLKKLNGYQYNLINDPTKSQTYGVIAQEILTLFPSTVKTNANGFYSVDYGALSALTASAVGQLATNADKSGLILKHLVKKDPTTLTVDIKTFQGNDAVFENIKSTNIKTANLEAENARIKQLEADRIESKFVRSDVVKTGEAEVFVSAGSFQPIFAPQADSQYIVNVTAEDGSSAFASVAFMSGKITVTPISGKGVDVTAMGTQVGLVAASKKVKATWIRMS